jgi:hypothetical protein
VILGFDHEPQIFGLGKTYIRIDVTLFLEISLKGTKSLV